MSHPVNSPVQTQWISLPTDGGTLDAYLALPPGGRGPGLLLLQEIFGALALGRSLTFLAQQLF